MNTGNRLIYLPLGGCGMFGANMYVYGWGGEGSERLIVVDCGIGFPDAESAPGVDVLIPDSAWLKDRLDRLEAIFITHAHEDHVGAIGHLHPELPVPVFARRFTAAVAKTKFEQLGRKGSAVQEVDPWPEFIEAGPFRVAFLPVAHSIPEAAALIIDSPAGRIVHSGDLNLDRTPVLGEAHDPERIRQAAGRDVLALVCDSTNVFNPQAGRSEATVAGPVAGLIDRSTGMFAATTFASNIGRLKSLAAAGIQAGRSVAVVGRSMHRILGIARETGFLEDFPEIVPLEEARYIPRNKLMLIVTGSQGERRSVSSQLSWGNYRGFDLEPGDSFLFSARTIPGNEKSVNAIKNRLSARGVAVHSAEGSPYHASGHACRPDIEEIHELVRPQIVIPMHGENQHLREHANLAHDRGFKSLFVSSGMVADISSPDPQVVDHVDTGVFCLDGSTRIGRRNEVIRERRKMAESGVIAAAIEFDLDGTAWCSGVSLKGVPFRERHSGSLTETLRKRISSTLAERGPLDAEKDEVIERIVTRVVHSTASRSVGKKPEVMVILTSDE